MLSNLLIITFIYYNKLYKINYNKINQVCNKNSIIILMVSPDRTSVRGLI